MFALPFLPAYDIPEAFQEVHRKVDDETEALVSFMDYVNDSWISSDFGVLSVGLCFVIAYVQIMTYKVGTTD